MLETQHVRQININDETSTKAFKAYLEALDPDKLFLLREDVTALKRYADQMDDELKTGQLVLAHVANSRFDARLTAIESIVQRQLKKSIDFSVDESLETDADKVDYLRTDKELEERWRKRLKLEILGRVLRMDSRSEALQKSIKESKDPEKKAIAQAALAKIPKDPIERQRKAREELAKSYDARFIRLRDHEALDSASGFFNAITHIFDPHTIYMPPAEKDNFDIAMSGSLEGIGAILSEDAHYIRVNELVPGGASWRQGELEAGDLILSVAQGGEEPIDVADMRINKVVQMIRGKAGTVVTLTVEKSDESIKTISITRDVVEIAAAYARGAILRSSATGKRFGYIYLPSFYGNTRGGDGPERRSADDVLKLLNIFQSKKVDGAIIDVRGNGGGLLEDARRITGQLIKTGPVVQTRTPDGALEVLEDTDPSIAFDKPMVIMVDRFSASASEILAAALQDYSRAIVVGPGPTHGKGTVQALLDLSRVSASMDGSAMGVLKLTVQQFFRVNGASTQWKGVVPDIAFPDPAAHIESGERHLDNSIPWSSVQALEHGDWQHAGWNLAEIASKSQARREKSQGFKKVIERSKLMKARNDNTLVPLNREKYEAEEKAHREAMKKLADDDKRVAGFSAEIVNYANDKPVPPRGGTGKARDPNKMWKESLLADFMLSEAVMIVGDMTAK
jgi:carboxyl-terminal processing protease